MENELYKKCIITCSMLLQMQSMNQIIKQVEILKQAQIDTEEMYISHCEIFPFDGKK